MTKRLSDAESAHKNVVDAKDEEIGKLKADLKQAQDAAAIDVDKLVAARSELVAQVKAIDAKIDPAGKTDADLRKAAVSAKLGDEMVKDASDAEINGMFKAVCKDVKPVNPIADAFRQGVKVVGDAAAQADEALRKANEDANAWRYKEGK